MGWAAPHFALAFDFGVECFGAERAFIADALKDRVAAI